MKGTGAPWTRTAGAATCSGHSQDFAAHSLSSAPLQGSGPSLMDRGSIFLKLVGFAALHFLGLVPAAHQMSCCGEAQYSYKKFKMFV